MNDVITNTLDKMEKSIENLIHRYKTIRAGRANPAILDSVEVSYYGVDTPLRQLAVISIPEAKQLAIKPFDKSALGAIEKAIFKAELGVTPNNNGEMIFIVFPPLTEERRKEYVKSAKQLAEEAKIAIRNIRQDANTNIKNDKLPKDEEDSLLEEVQELVSEYNKKIEDLQKEKENELMNI